MEKDPATTPQVVPASTVIYLVKEQAGTPARGIATNSATCLEARSGNAPCFVGTCHVTFGVTSD